MRADDLVQQTYLQAFTKLSQFSPGSNMFAWLSTILRNRFVSDRRKEKREQEWDPEFENSLKFSSGTGEHEAETAHDFRRLIMYIACLPLEQSDALIAVGYLGLKYEDVAERLNCAVGTVKSRVNRAREALLILMEGAVVREVQFAQLKTATKGFSKDHPYFPIAQAYEDLFAECEDISRGSRVSERQAAPSDEDAIWQDLVTSGALDESVDDFDALIRGTDH
jgi:RNA polymerase sigma-70 factor (ECF subfamily)